SIRRTIHRTDEVQSAAQRAFAGDGESVWISDSRRPIHIRDRYRRITDPTYWHVYGDRAIDTGRKRSCGRSRTCKSFITCVPWSPCVAFHAGTDSCSRSILVSIISRPYDVVEGERCAGRWHISEIGQRHLRGDSRGRSVRLKRDGGDVRLASCPAESGWILRVSCGVGYYVVPAARIWKRGLQRWTNLQVDFVAGVASTDAVDRFNRIVVVAYRRIGRSVDVRRLAATGIGDKHCFTTCAGAAENFVTGNSGAAVIRRFPA